MESKENVESEIMKWEHLLDTRTILNWIQKSDEYRPAVWDSYMKDYYAITESSFFRRLSGKTQVFSMDKNDSIRTRLTHSIEVATIAEMLGRKVGNELVKRRKAYGEYREYIEKVPEYAIWFEKNEKALEAFNKAFSIEQIKENPNIWIGKMRVKNPSTQATNEFLKEYIQFVIKHPREFTKNRIESYIYSNSFKPNRNLSIFNSSILLCLLLI